MPSVPGADDFSILDDAFAEWKTEMRAQVFQCVDLTVPAEYGEIETIGPNRMTQTFICELGQRRHPMPVTHDSPHPER